MAKQLKLWNGRPYGVLRPDRWTGVYICAAAYSRSDVRRLCFELGLNVPSDNEIKVYWSPCWGVKMNGITPERGVWIVPDAASGKPERVPPR